MLDKAFERSSGASGLAARAHPLPPAVVEGSQADAGVAALTFRLWALSERLTGTKFPL
jgi:hypothetical protein